MNFFKDYSLLYKIFGVYLALLFIYFQLLIRRENIVSSFFREDSATKIIPQKVFWLKKMKDGLLLSALALIAFSAAGPQWGREFTQNDGFSGNIVLAIDTSLSMSAQDISPSRIESAKIAAKYLFKDLSDYKFAVFTFQGKPYIQCPMTSDYDALAFFVDSIYPNMLPFRGTNIPALIKAASEYMSRYEGEKMLVMFTDGEDHHKGEIKEALDLATKSSVKIMTVAVGTIEGDLIKDPKTGEYKKDVSGNTVLSKMDENYLIQISQATRGKYLKYSTPEKVSEEIREFAETIKKSVYNSRTFSVYKNRYQIPLFLALLLIMIEFILMEETISFSFSLLKRKMFLFFFLFFISFNLFASPINSMAARGNKSYKKRDYSQAYDYYKKAYDKSADDKLLFNIGAALNKMGEYSKSAEALENIKDVKIKAKALYNAANSRAMANEKDRAIEDYKRSLMLNPLDENAAHNLQFLLENKTCKNPDEKRNNDKKESSENDRNKSNDQDNKSNKDNPEKKRAEQILNMMKEKEKENRKKMDKQKLQRQASDDYETNDW